MVTHSCVAYSFVPRIISSMNILIFMPTLSKLTMLLLTMMGYKVIWIVCSLYVHVVENNLLV